MLHLFILSVWCFHTYGFTTILINLSKLYTKTIGGKNGKPKNRKTQTKMSNMQKNNAVQQTRKILVLSRLANNKVKVKNMDITIKIGKSRLAYIPKKLCEVLGNSPKATPNRAAVLLCAEHTSIEDVLKSLDIIKRDLLHAKEMQEQKEEKGHDGTTAEHP